MYKPFLFKQDSDRCEVAKDAGSNGCQEIVLQIPVKVEEACERIGIRIILKVPDIPTVIEVVALWKTSGAR